MFSAAPPRTDPTAASAAPSRTDPTAASAGAGLRAVHGVFEGGLDGRRTRPSVADVGGRGVAARGRRGAAASPAAAWRPDRRAPGERGRGGRGRGPTGGRGCHSSWGGGARSSRAPRAAAGRWARAWGAPRTPRAAPAPPGRGGSPSTAPSSGCAARRGGVDDAEQGAEIARADGDVHLARAPGGSRRRTSPRRGSAWSGSAASARSSSALDRRRQIGTQRARRRDDARRDLAPARDLVGDLAQAAAGEQLEQDAPSEKMSVRRSSGACIACSGDMYDEVPLEAADDRAIVPALGEAEVRQLHLARERDEDVRRRHVAVDEPQRLPVRPAQLVREVQPLRDLGGDVQRQRLGDDLARRRRAAR